MKQAFYKLPKIFSQFTNCLISQIDANIYIYIEWIKNVHKKSLRGWILVDFWYVILWNVMNQWSKNQLDNFLFHVNTYFSPSIMHGRKCTLHSCKCTLEVHMYILYRENVRNAQLNIHKCTSQKRTCTQMYVWRINMHGNVHLEREHVRKCTFQERICTIQPKSPLYSIILTHVSCII